MILTLFGIMLMNFFIIQAAPGGPIQQVLAKIRGTPEGSSVFERVGGEIQDGTFSSSNTIPNVRSVEAAFIQKLEKQFEFDKPFYERFFNMIKKFLFFDFGESFFKGQSVLSLIYDKLPVSISLGFWSLLLTYGIALPLGIKKALKDGSFFDAWTSGFVIVGYAIPGFLFAILLIILFAGGSYFTWFPLKGLVSSNFENLTFLEKIKDYFWHLTLPLTALTLGSFAKLTLLTKNVFLEEIRKPYVLTARARGCSEKRILYSHIFRNAMLIIIAGFPAAFVSILFTSSLLIEVLFSLDGLGLLGFEAAMNRDYPVIFGSIYIYTLTGLIMHFISDLTYAWIDPRIQLSAQGERA